MITAVSPSTSPTAIFQGKRPPLINAKVTRVGQSPPEYISNSETSVGADQFAESIPIAAIEALDIEIQQLHQFRILGGWQLDWYRRDLFLFSIVPGGALL